MAIYYMYVYTAGCAGAAPDHNCSAHVLACTISAGNESTKTGDKMATESGRAKTRPARPLATALINI